MNDILTLLPRLKSDYLDARGVGIRRFATMSKIRRPRLVAILAGTITPTVDELECIHTAFLQIETAYHTHATKPCT